MAGGAVCSWGVERLQIVLGCIYECTNERLLTQQGDVAVRPAAVRLLICLKIIYIYIYIYVKDGCDPCRRPLNLERNSDRIDWLID